MHRNILIPSNADIVIHCGDACIDGNEEQLDDFFRWFSHLPVRYKIFIPGNHDLPFEFDPDYAQNLIPANVISLEDFPIKIGGIAFSALNARPWMHEPVEITKKPDIIISHGAPAGIMDEKKGCKILASMIERYKPEYHIFGHYHNVRAGKFQNKHTTFCNVSYSGTFRITNSTEIHPEHNELIIKQKSGT